MLKRFWRIPASAGVVLLSADFHRPGCAHPGSHTTIGLKHFGGLSGGSGSPLTIFSARSPHGGQHGIGLPAGLVAPRGCLGELCLEPECKPRSPGLGTQGAGCPPPAAAPLPSRCPSWAVRLLAVAANHADALDAGGPAATCMSASRQEEGGGNPAHSSGCGCRTVTSRAESSACALGTALSRPNPSLRPRDLLASSPTDGNGGAPWGPAHPSLVSCVILRLRSSGSGSMTVTWGQKNAREHSQSRGARVCPCRRHELELGLRLQRRVHYCGVRFIVTPISPISFSLQVTRGSAPWLISNVLCVVLTYPRSYSLRRGGGCDD